ncbi:hypothetical protein GGS24DRAFT_487293 [Hypoxylon argillaceum]|nr:hypothetical protein GGS24DRAFT_487293 [Hypoxylon argillaceum]KAI1149012.1 hypothetical protein F4825DRAFT_464440 [Nemania diffusa]
MELSERNNISIAQIVFFVPYLVVAILLCNRHSWGHSAGWLFLVIFSIARLLGASLQLATAANPTNLSLYFGALTLQSIGLSNLTVTLLGLIARALKSISKARSPVINPRILFYAQLLVLVGVILAIVGGTESSSTYADTGVYNVSPLAQAGVALTIAGFALLVIATAVAGLHVASAEPGEKRLVLAVALSLPFFFVRVLYTAIGTYNPHSAFSTLTGSVNVFLGTAVIEELIIMFIVEAIGLTLQIQPKNADPNSSEPSFFGLWVKRVKGRYGGYEMQNRNSGRLYDASSV